MGNIKQEPPALTEFTYYILISLAQEGEDGLHGYGILQSIKEITKGLRTYALPSLYEALGTLRDNGLIELARQEPENGRLRKYFRITGAGEGSMRRYHDESEKIRQSVRRSVPELKVAHEN
jgi:DNA-binding PadR family transcriptional regulator